MRKNVKLLKLKLVSVFSISVVICLSVLYVFQTNFEISERYLIQKYSQESNNLSKENKELEISSAQISSLNKIAELVEPLNFEKTEKIHYIRVIDTHVVAK